MPTKLSLFQLANQLPESEHGLSVAGSVGRPDLWAACKASASQAWSNRHKAHHATASYELQSTLEAEGCHVTCMQPPCSLPACACQQGWYSAHQPWPPFVGKQAAPWAR